MTSKSTEAITDILGMRKCRYVERMAGTPKLRSYSLAEHQYFVGMMFLDIASRYEVPIDISYQTLDIVFRHDMLEILTGDLRWTAKNLTEETSKSWNKIESAVKTDAENKKGFRVYTDSEIEKLLSPIEYDLLRMCDTAELYLFCMEEVSLGNSNSSIYEIIDNCRKIVCSRLRREDTYPFYEVFRKLMIPEDEGTLR